MDRCEVVGGRVYATDFSGFLYCLDADTGRIRWRFETAAHVWAGPLYVDGKLYIGDEDGDAIVLKLDGWEELLRKAGEPLLVKQGSSRITLPDGKMRELTKNEAALLLWKTTLPRPIYAPQIFANGVLYINILSHLIAITPSSQAIEGQATIKWKVPDAIFVATVQDVVERMLELAEVKSSDRVYDLGSGDGRIVITAAKKYGCNADPARQGNHRLAWVR